jgi:hypothetical protein
MSITEQHTPRIGGRNHELVDATNGRISREIFVSEEIFQQELENLFTRCWLFIGHESQIPNPGDYFVSRMGIDSVLMTRDNEEKINVLLNSCRLDVLGRRFLSHVPR